MIRSLFLAVLIFSFLPAAKSQISELPINNPESVISFSVGFAGGITSIEGRFDKFSGLIGYKNPNDLASLYVHLKIEVASLNTGDEERNSDLMGASFFNVEAYPEITFKSKSVRRRGSGYLMTGAFSMMGKTIELEVPFERTHPQPLAWVFGEPRIAVKGETVLNRIDFGIPQRGWDNILPSLGSMSLSKDVKVNISLMGMGQGVSGIMVEAAMSNGAEVAIARYNELEKEFGKTEHTYSFGGRTLAGVVLQLTRDGKPDIAREIGQFGVSHVPDSFLVFYALAGAYTALDDKPNAIANYKKTLELNPDFARAKAALDKLK